MNRNGDPPVDYLCDCSDTSLRYFEMSKLEHVANLRRELTVLLDEMMQESALALLARWMIEKRALPGGGSRNGSVAKSVQPCSPRSLLRDFVSGALLVPGMRAGSNGQAAKSNGDGPASGNVPAEQNAGHGPAGNSRAQGAGQRAAPRCERPVERRRARAARSGVRPHQETC